MNVGAVEGIIRIKDEFTQAFTRFNSQLEKSGNNMRQVGQTMTQAGTAMTKAITAPLLAIGTTATIAGARYESEMTKILALVMGVTSKTREQVNQWSSDIKKIAVEVGRGPQELAEAMFVVTSAGQRGAEALEILRYAGQAAAVGLGETKEIARTVTAVMQAYGEETYSAERATEILVSTVREGNLEAADLAGSLGRVLGIASQVGVSFEEVGGFIATFTRLGVDSAEAVTSLRGIMNSILSPSEQAKEAFKKLGTSVEEVKDKIAKEGLTKAMMDLLKAAEGDTTIIAELVPNVRALAGILGTAGAQGEDYVEIINKMNTSHGILKEGFEVVQQTLTYQWNQIWAQIKKVATEFGESFMPIIKNFVIPAIRELVNWLEIAVNIFKQLPEPVKIGVLAVAGIAAAIGPVLVGGGLLVTLIGTVMQNVTLLAATFGGLKVALVTLSGTVLPALGVALLAVATAIAAYKLTDWTLEWTGARKAVDWFYESMLKLYGVIGDVEKSSQEMDILAKATNIAGREITNWNEAIKIVNEENNKARERMERYTQRVNENTTAVGNSTKSLREQARELIEQRNKLDKLAQASSVAGKDISDLAFAEIILAEQTRMANQEIVQQAINMEMSILPMDRVRAAVEYQGKTYQTSSELLKKWALDQLGITERVLTDAEKIDLAIHERVQDSIDAVEMLSDETLEKLGIAGTGVEQFANVWNVSLSAAADIIRIFEGSVAESIARIIGYMSAAADAGRQVRAGLSQGGLAGIAQAGMGLMQGAGAVWAATGQGTRAQRVAGGASTGAAFGTSIMPGIGTAIGAGVGAIVGLFRGRGTRNLIKQIGREWGVDITEEMAKEIEKLAKALDVTKMQAALLKLSDMIVGEGGITTQNFEKYGKLFTDLMKNVADGTLPLQQGLQAVNETFFAMLPGLQSMGDAGVFQIGRMVKEMRELGLITADVQDQIDQWISEGISALGRYFEALNQQTDLSSQQVESAMQLMASAIAMAIEQTGSLYLAFQSLPESFTQLIERFRESGIEGPVFQRIEELYAFIEANEGPLAAITALSDAIRAFGQAGLLTAEDLTAFGAAAEAEFNRLIESGADMTTIIAAIGPQLAMLYRAYQDLGMDVPPWLEAISEDLEGMEPPRDTGDILSSIEDAIWAIAEALGAATRESDRLNTSLSNTPSPTGNGNGDERGDERRRRQMQVGGWAPARPPYGQEYVLGETTGEWVIPESERGRAPGHTGSTISDSGRSQPIINLYITDNIVGDDEKLAERIVGGVKNIFQNNKDGAGSSLKTWLDERA